MRTPLDIFPGVWEFNLDDRRRVIPERAQGTYGLSPIHHTALAVWRPQYYASAGWQFYTYAYPDYVLLYSHHDGSEQWDLMALSQHRAQREMVHSWYEVPEIPDVGATIVNDMWCRLMDHNWGTNTPPERQETTVLQPVCPVARPR